MEIYETYNISGNSMVIMMHIKVCHNGFRYTGVIARNLIA